jgi:BirA family biotin operon repressor/biotin-[acetyl-CoA-carboxylase] ligase
MEWNNLIQKWGDALEVHPELPSTNDYLKTLALQGAYPQGYCVVAIQQTAGRGQQEKTWWSQPNYSLTASFLWNTSKPLQDLSVIPLLIGVATLQGLHSLGVQNLSLKWPNDILRAQKKISGILVERISQPQGSALIIGIGVNIKLPPIPPTDIKQPLNDLGLPHLTPAQVLEIILPHCLAYLHSFERGEPIDLLDIWWPHCLHAQQKITLTTPQGLLEGIHVGLTPQGALILNTNAGIQTIHSGGVSLRLSPSHENALS